MQRYDRTMTFEEIRHFVNRPDPVILEIGANDGRDTNHFLAAFPELVMIHCFEPDPRAIAKWRNNVTDSRAVLHPIALTDRVGIQVFHQSNGVRSTPTEWDESGSLLTPTGHLTRWPDCEFRQNITVQTDTLDQWAMEHKVTSVDFIWMDVQGAELKVLQCGERALSRTRYIKMECHTEVLYDGQPTEEEMTYFMRERGFHGIARYLTPFNEDILFENTQL